MANTYKISFELTKQFAVAGKEVNFNILDSNNDRVTGLESNLTAVGSLGTTFTIATTTGDYDYTLTVDTPSASGLEANLETVSVKYTDEDISTYNNTLSLAYLPEIEGIDMYIGQEYMPTWLQGTATVKSVADNTKATLDAGKLTGVAEGSTTCVITYALSESLTEDVEDVEVGVSTPEVTSPVASNLDKTSVTLSATSTPEEVTIMKFRYGLVDEFDPEDDTTYTETAATDGTLNITGLEEDTEYACQSVIVAFGNTYVDKDSDYVTFKTTTDAAVEFNKEEVNLLAVETSTNTVKATLNVEAQGTLTYKWTSSSAVTLTNDETDTVTVAGVATDLESDLSEVTLTCTITDTLDEVVVNKVTGNVKINLYGVKTSMDLYIDSTSEKAGEEILWRNSILTYESVEATTGGDTTYELTNVDPVEDDPDTHRDESVPGYSVVKALAEGTGTITTTVSLEDVFEATEVVVTVNVYEAFVAPTISNAIENGVIYNDKVAMFGNYKGVQVKEVKLEANNSELTCYCFRNNTPDEIKWSYDIALMDDDVDKYLMKATNA